jgi:hypothetical protein
MHLMKTQGFGKLVRFDADEITEWLQNHRHPEANRDRSA